MTHSSRLPPILAPISVIAAKSRTIPHEKIGPDAEADGIDRPAKDDDSISMSPPISAPDRLISPPNLAAPFISRSRRTLKLFALTALANPEFRMSSPATLAPLSSTSPWIVAPPLSTTALSERIRSPESVPSKAVPASENSRSRCESVRFRLPSIRLASMRISACRSASERSMAPPIWAPRRRIRGRGSWSRQLATVSTSTRNCGGSCRHGSSQPANARVSSCRPQCAPKSAIRSWRSWAQAQPAGVVSSAYGDCAAAGAVPANQSATTLAAVRCIARPSLAARRDAEICQPAPDPAARGESVFVC